MATSRRNAIPAEEAMPASKTVKKTTRKPVKQPTPRLPAIPEDKLTPEQAALIASIRSGPRGHTQIRGPFAIFLHAPTYGEHAQKLGGHVRYKTAVPARLSEFAILVTARLWRAQFEWFAHAPLAERAGVKPQTIADLRAGRVPTKASKDERAIYDFIQELYRTKRVSDRNYARVNALLGDAGTVELVGILGYYVLVAMTLNVFRAPLPEDATPAFAEPK
jgi:4-carboxymuconolactone decarboxylase